MERLWYMEHELFLIIIYRIEIFFDMAQVDGI
jgi:hypothetical protein